MSRTPTRLRPRCERDQNGSHPTEESDMKYLLLKHYRSTTQPAAANDHPMHE